MKLLLIDAGNSFCKYSAVDAAMDSSSGSVIDGCFPLTASQLSPLDQIESRFSELQTPDLCVVCSVNSSATKRINAAWERRLDPQQLVYLTAANSPIEILVDNPEKLGSDRMAAAIGAYARCETQVIVVDSGTATTIDLVDNQGRFCGGTISPGIQLGIQALAREADQLDEIDADLESLPERLGTNTASAIQSGTFWSQVGGIERIVNNLRSDFGSCPVYFTGGHAKLLSQAARLEATYVETLVLEGLWQVGLSLIGSSR